MGHLEALRPNVLFIFRAEETQKVTANQITTSALPSATAPRCRKRAGNSSKMVRFTVLPMVSVKRA